MKPEESSDRKPAETVLDPDLAGNTAAMHRPPGARRRPPASGTPVTGFGHRKVAWARGG